jgi:sodium/proline symporter
MVVITSFISLLIIFVISGLIFNGSSSLTSNKDKLKRYFIAGGDTNPFLVAFATFSTNTSAFMFTGFIAFTYFYGFSAIWLIVGWVVGDLLSSLMFYKRMLNFTKRSVNFSFPSLITNLLNPNYKYLRFIISIVALIFISCYAVAQIIGGGKVISSLLSTTEIWGSFFTISILAFYCTYGGLKASILVNTLQSIAMLFGAGIILFSLIAHIGGLDVFLDGILQLEPSFRDVTPNYLSGKSNIVFFILGWIFAGLGTAGMPHTVMQVMSLDKVSNLTKMRLYYYSIYSFFAILTFFIGIGIRVYVPNLTFAEAEGSLIETSKAILNPVLHGFILASIFASIISTVDSQAVACTSIISQDLMKKNDAPISLIRILMILMLLTLFALSILTKDTIFFLYTFAWSGMASGFAPLIFLIVFKFKMSQASSICVVLTGCIVSVVWCLLGLNSIMHEVFVGILSGFIAYVVTSKLTSK